MEWKMGQGDPYALLAPLLGVEKLPEIRRTERGKPYFARGDRHFSVSRSRGLALCAVSDWEIGADIEQIRPRKSQFPRYVLSEREWSQFLERGSRWEDFYALWTMKEAYVKCTGEGIFRRPPREIAVPFLSVGEELAVDGFLFTALGGSDWRGAICQKEF